MKELMIHVERIVRPVRAFAGRKLHMRQELLNHLQAALEEERAIDGDEPAAIDRAKLRLGQPSELCRTLQHSVPWIERTLMARLPVPRAMDRLESRSMRWRHHCPLTLLQATVLVFVATIPSFVGLIELAIVVNHERTVAQRMMFDRPLTWVAFNLGSILLYFALLAISSRFIVAIASAAKSRWSRTILIYAGVIVASPLLSIVLLLGCVSRRAATGREQLLSIGVGFALLAVQWLAGRLIATMRRPYAEWLILDAAG